MSSDDNVLLRFSIGVALEEKSKIEKVTKKRLIFTSCRGSERNDKKVWQQAYLAVPGLDLAMMDWLIE